MTEDIDYIQKNKELWNARTEHHLESDFYDVKGFLEGRNSLNEIELKLLGDVTGKKILHLQCHFGQDTISLARMGAKVTGADFSDTAIENAVMLASKLKVEVDFVCCDVYSLTHCLMEKFDIVFTSYGTIGWLPDVEKWAEIVSHYLNPGGKFVFADFHPVVWMFDDNFEKIAYNYFNAGPIVEIETGSYANRNAPLKNEYIGWNHNTGEVLNSLIKSGLTINSFDEYDYSPYNAFKNMVESGPGQFRIKGLDNKLPLVFSLVATKKSGD
jgi:2-polyprenyl-3-methyl-5-hydroxy-6-metoxy-1,4-benzoquinol methylase